MADSAIAITAGAGTNIDTRTEGTNSNHRQVIVIGDPATNAGVAPVDATNGLAVDVKKVGGQTPDFGTGNAGAATQRVVIASDQLASSQTAATTMASGYQLVAFPTDAPGIKVDDAAFTPGTSTIVMQGMQADESSTDSVDEGDAGAPRMTLDRKQIVTPQPHTAGGLSIFRSLDLDETEEDVKTAAGCVYGMWVTNTATTTRFVKFYNATAANVTVGTTTPVITIGIPGNTSDDVSGLFSSTHGIMFDTAICAAATTGVADNDTGAPGANEVIINIFYK